MARVGAKPTHDDPLVCGSPLQDREGKFALKYLGMDQGAGLEEAASRSLNVLSAHHHF
jgi:hypothetical protein